MFEHVCLLNLFTVLATHNALQRLRVAKENCWTRYCIDWLRPKYRCRHSNDVIVI